MKKIIVSPSILGCDFLHLEEEVEKIIKAPTTWIHLDVMDGHFVPRFTFGSTFIRKSLKSFPLIKDVHLMISNPNEVIDEYKEAGADYLTFHYEALDSDELVNQTIYKIHQAGMKAGLSIKPGTDVNKVYPFLNKLDLVLVMSVEPGFGGQKFMDLAIYKIAALRKKIDELGLKTLISVDGGVNNITGKECVEAGVDILVVGNYLFRNDNFQERFDSLLDHE